MLIHTFRRRDALIARAKRMRSAVIALRKDIQKDKSLRHHLPVVDAIIVETELLPPAP